MGSIDDLSNPRAVASPGGHASDSKRPRVLALFDRAKAAGRPLHVCAPMVRYSKLPFRLLLHSYDVDVTFTPMILAHEFVRAQIARDSDFTTHPREQSVGAIRPALIAQFASSDPTEFARAAELISPWVDGVDLNCGCPQSWAVKEGIGCSLMGDAALVAEMVRAAKGRLADSGGKTVSVKIRIHKDPRETERWIKIVEQAGVDFITIHGRTRSQRSSTPPDYEAIRNLKSRASVPIIANGDAYDLEGVNDIASKTGVNGVMAARGILENPAMFAGHPSTPAECVARFLGWAVKCPIPFALVLHHVGEMTARTEHMNKKERKRLMQCQDLIDLMDYVEAKWGPDVG